MPGAEFKDVVGDDRWKALMHVKLGPIALQFDVDIERRDIDDSGLRVTLDAQAREIRRRGGRARPSSRGSPSPRWGRM
jgi:hypothetical protein